MAWARTKLQIQDNVYEPYKEVLFNYSGKNPQFFYNKAKALILHIFTIAEHDIQERDYELHKEGKTDKFSVSWEARKPFDVFSYLRLQIKMKGEVTNGYGKVTVKTVARLVTEYAQDNIWQQNIFYEILRRLWHEYFYHKKRLGYMQEAKILSTSFQNNLKKYAEELRANG